MIAIFHFFAYRPQFSMWQWALIVGIAVALLDVAIRDLRAQR